MVHICACLRVSYYRLICPRASLRSVHDEKVGGVTVGPGKGSNHKHLNLQMALMSCAKQPVLTDEPVNPG